MRAITRQLRYHEIMQSRLARVKAKDAYPYDLCEHWRMAQRDLVAALRAHKAADARLKEARAVLDGTIRQAVTTGEWQIADVAELTGWSRETIRKIAYPKD